MSGSGQPLEMIRLLRKLFEKLQPDLRQYYRLPIKARVEKVYEAGGSYVIDAQPLRNDESVDEQAPVLQQVEAPLVWAAQNRGVFCLPRVGTTVAVGFFDGDPNYPYVQAVRSHGLAGPEHPVDALIIQQGPGVYITIDPEGNIITVTSADQQTEVGGELTIDVGGPAVIRSGESITVQAPRIALAGNLTATNHTGGAGINLVIGNLHVTGTITSESDILAAGTNSNHHSHS